ncbi:MAG: hypothetical protein J0M12_05355 [Deltaproteobacteria bacterium]|nr:hypothetical protein [Deltaproteobacteria bacterium]
MAHIIHLNEFRARSVSLKCDAVPQSPESKAQDLMSAAARILLESSPANVRVAWMLQDLCDLLSSSQANDDAALCSADLNQQSTMKEVLTNLG